MPASNDLPAQKVSSPDWAQILMEAVVRPGVISTAYSRFWNYSIGNQLLAMFQCLQRNITPGPIHTFQGWKQLGRFVKKGEKAITLCMPVILNKGKPRRDKPDPLEVRVDDGKEHQPIGSGEIETTKKKPITLFTYKPHWFVLAQTEGTEYVPTDVPHWSENTALAELQIERIAFDDLDGNVQGFAHGRRVSVSPIAVMPHKTLFHELAHIVLGHTEKMAKLDDHESTPVNLREVEAECVALICCESLGMPGGEFSRGYIQHWLGKETIPDRSAQKVFKAADAILKAGRISTEPAPSPSPKENP